MVRFGETALQEQPFVVGVIDVDAISLPLLLPGVVEVDDGKSVVSAVPEVAVLLQVDGLAQEVGGSGLFSHFELALELPAD
jgi:hypothetical protein